MYIIIIVEHTVGCVYSYMFSSLREDSEVEEDSEAIIANSQRCKEPLPLTTSSSDWDDQQSEHTATDIQDILQCHVLPSPVDPAQDNLHSQFLWLLQKD